MPTKAHHRFAQRVDSYNADLELCDVIVRRFLGQANSDHTIAEALNSTNERHPFLGRRQNNRQSRMIVGRHLVRTLHTAFVKDLFEDFSEFLSTTLVRAAQRGIDPARFVGDVKLELSAATILKTGNWDAAVQEISDAIFRKLENERNSKELIRKASVRLGLALNAQVVDAAMPYLDARHILVHRDGKTDEIYRNDYPHIELDGDRIQVNFAFVSAARDRVTTLVRHIDDQIIAMGLVRRQDMVGQQAPGPAAV